ncbi:helix-turn-helix domain-containing protein [Marinobacter sp. 1-4A]|uniref:helix-turn-helix transcriptional regulator n=1 Tax=Marinobacter sp. 1-4A TaxID=2582919 RepID=UPI0019054BDB|nr:helix-turn-helix domain-containing protein [Marinobacter sp. 1-4A]MBK1851555.1 helix-turn-helix domain-containing protein [Marinobacter sp. 1-4A]
MTEKEMLQRVLQDMMVLKKIILDHVKGSKVPESDKEIMNLEECAEFTGLKKSTLYQLTSQKKIPYFKPNGNRIFFKRADVLQWLQSNRIATADEIEQAAAQHLVSHRRPGHRRV